MELNIVFFVLNLYNFCVVTVGHFRKQDGCPSSNWSMNIPRGRCLKFYPEFHDFAHAEQLCQQDRSNIPHMDIDDDVTSAFQHLYLNFTNSSFQFWTRKHQSSLGRTVNKRTTNKAKKCEFIKMGREWNISRHTRNCNEEIAVLCEYIINDSTNKLFPEDLFVLDTRDLVAIGAGIFIVAMFCLVVLLDIIKHIRSPEQKTTDITRV